MAQTQIINFLEATVIFLLMTNAVSVIAASYFAMKLASGLDHNHSAGGEENSSELSLRRLRRH